MKCLLCVPLLFVVSGCSILKPSLPMAPPPLVDMEEPLELREEPDDEAQRAALPIGSFTGIYVKNRATSLDALTQDNDGVLVARVVENSPADLAGVVEDDIILEVRTAGATTAPRWPSEWRAIELAAPVGAALTLVVDRAGVERTLELVTVQRARAPERAAAERFREELKVGVVLRTATEVEARAAGIGPGGGAVIVGLAGSSPWRAASLRYQDLVARVDGVEVAHPQVLIDAIRAKEAGELLELDVVRGGKSLRVCAAVSKRRGEMREVSIPFLYSYTYDRGRSETSILFGMFKRETTPAAWTTRLFWFIEFGGGEADRLAEEGS
ncbi:MAG: PDZ domain-containing protein [Planctomycetes bacterium]|nr:PDZ domain-containing protein [Planctomycetota bacterium]